MSLPLIISLVALITSLLGNIEKLAKWYLNFKGWRKKKTENWGKLFGGNWNNQGQIKNRPTHYIDMDGGGNGKTFEGQFNVRKSDDENGWEMFKISGKRSFKTLKCKIFRIVDGAEVLVASGILKMDVTGLCWILEESIANQFPKEALLRRGLPKIA